MPDQGLTSRMLTGESFAGEGTPVNPFFAREGTPVYPFFASA